MVSEPFEVLMRKISSGTSTAADAVPAVTVLNRLLTEENSTDTGIKQWKASCQQAIQQHRKWPLYAVAILLDARYKDRWGIFFINAQFINVG